jgi:hypothetical protein
MKGMLVHIDGELKRASVYATAIESGMASSSNWLEEAKRGNE